MAKPVDRKRSPARRGTRHAADAASSVMSAVAERKGFAETRVLTRWVEIVGPELSSRCRPVTVKYGSNRAMAATLVVEADGGRAAEVTHLGPKLIERVNQYYGYRAIGRISVRQGVRTAAGFAEGQKAFEGQHGTSTAAPSEPTDTDRRRAEQLTKSIQTPELRDALARMGSHVLARSRQSQH